MNEQSTRAYIGLGSNLNNPIEQIQNALKAIAAIPATVLVAQSHLYRNPPFFPPPQPDYINAVIAVDTHLTAHQLLQYLQNIEKEHGRTRHTVRFGPRTLDLDLLLYGNLSISTSKLIVPHPGLAERNFVLYPLAEIAPDLCLPSGILLKDLLINCSAKGLEKLDGAA